MSLLNVLDDGDRVAVVVDSGTFTCADSPYPVAGSRLHVVPLPRVLLASRFGAPLWTVAAGVLCDQACNFDECEGRLRAWLDRLATGPASQRSALHGDELIVAGWSDRRCRTVVLRVTHPADALVPVVEDLWPADGLLMPDVAGVTDTADIRTVAGLVAVARRQAVAWNRAHPARPMLGPLQLGEVRRGRLTITCHALADHDPRTLRS